MVLGDAEILLGKIAIGRSYLSRENALRVVSALADLERSGRREPFHSAAVRLGFLERQRAQELVELLRTGELVCRGRCGRRVRLATVSPRDSVACAICGGPLYLNRNGSHDEPPPADGDAEISLDAPAAPAAKVRNTIMELSVDPALLDEEPAPVIAEPAPEHRTVASPSGFGAAPGPALPLDQDALPTIARRVEDAERTAEMDGPMSPVAADPGGLDKTWRSDAPVGEEFEPFTVGDLQVLAPIGRGGMGSVYRARWRGNTVAVKILAAPPDNPDVMARFEREVKTSGALDHPNIVRVFATGTMPPDFGGGPGKPYFVMDYVKGRDLAAWRQEKPRSYAECVRMVVTLCQAMEHAHSRGVIHRDLKPGNILVREGDDQPTICDFGLAKYKAEAHALTRPGDILGTPSYMPPEQALGQPDKIGPPTDVYALGALLYHLVTGKPPFLGPTAFLTIAKVIKEPPEPPRKLVPELPEVLEMIILKALAKEPSGRFRTCAELRKALASVR